ncbi:hypothetical protein MTER_42750 [Mycolicibacter terrae]|uniref:Uncharacterized protein n=1 Tax=Mycolicibacter terrae TaxID=1788 RepID=A0AAD1I0T6_9MYCO|nr:hypothetical protein [Mycolicibacter terrae]BBX24864.1 hypothetical protein MTER_42750 [Mycolicibacter terrae]
MAEAGLVEQVGDQGVQRDVADACLSEQLGDARVAEAGHLDEAADVEVGIDRLSGSQQAVEQRNAEIAVVEAGAAVEEGVQQGRRRTEQRGERPHRVTEVEDVTQNVLHGVEKRYPRADSGEQRVYPQRQLDADVGRERQQLRVDGGHRVGEDVDDIRDAGQRLLRVGEDVLQQAEHVDRVLVQRLQVGDGVVEQVGVRREEVTVRRQCDGPLLDGRELMLQLRQVRGHGRNRDETHADDSQACRDVRTECLLHEALPD